MTQEDVLEKENGKKNIIYLSVDHLKKGSYNLRITLKNKVTINHTILQEIASDYKPIYASVIKLSDNDVRIVKENFLRAKKSNDHKTLLIIKEKIIGVIGEEPHPDITAENFISRVLKDYNYYTARM